MKKVISIILLGLFLVSYASAHDVDNEYISIDERLRARIVDEIQEYDDKVLNAILCSENTSLCEPLKQEHKGKSSAESNFLNFNARIQEDIDTLNKVLELNQQLLTIGTFTTYIDPGDQRIIKNAIKLLDEKNVRLRPQKREVLKK